MAVGSIATRGRAARRSWKQSTIGSWVTTTDHKKLGIMYVTTGFIFFLVGGIEASLIRWQLAQPNSTVLTPSQYDQVFTMHALTMIFLFVMPTMAGFGNFLVPLMIGARDMAFPRLNALGYWLIFFAGIFLYGQLSRGIGSQRRLVQLCSADRGHSADAITQGIANLSAQAQAAYAANAAAQGVCLLRAGPEH